MTSSCATTTKVRPILFSAPMVRAMLDGTKTQTRRVVKPQPTAMQHGWMWVCKKLLAGYAHTDADALMRLMLPHCPHGQAGDRLWVRESIGFESACGHYYAATHDGTLLTGSWVHPRTGCASGNELPLRPVPSIHMPRWAARITLEVTGVRVERLQDISPSDCEAEGVRRLPLQEAELNPWYTADVSAGSALHSRSTIGAYHKLWESINGPGSWAANPWVWVIEFKRVKP